MKKLSFLFSLLLPISTAFGQFPEDVMPWQYEESVPMVVAGNYTVPKVTIGGINGPVDYGEMVILSADWDVSKRPPGLVNMSFNWTVIDEGKLKKYFNNGKQIAFATGLKPRHITVILDVNCLFETTQKVQVVDGDKTVEKVIVTEAQMASPTPIFADIQVGNEPAPIPPGPEPTFPDGKYGLAKFTYQAFMADTDLTYDSKVKLANVLANKLSGIASKIRAVNDYRDMSAIFADTKAANDEAFASLNIDLTRTEGLKATIRKQLYALYSSGKLHNALDLATAYQEMVQGLRSVK